MKSRYALLGAFLAGILAIIGIKRILDDQQSRLEQQQQPTRILAAAENLSDGQVLREQDLAEREIPNAYFDKSMITPKGRADVIGKKLRVPLAKGTFLRYVDVIEPQETRRVQVIPTGKRLYTVSVDLHTGVGGHLSAGAVVDVIAIVREAASGAAGAAPAAPGAPVRAEGSRAVTVLQGVPVFVVGPTMVGPSGYAVERSQYTAVTLVVTPAEAELLAYAGAQGKLVLAERSNLDVIPGEIPARGVGTANFDALIQDLRREGK